MTASTAESPPTPQSSSPSSSAPSLDLQELKALSVLGRGAKGVVFLVRSSSHKDIGDLALKAISRLSIEQKAATPGAADTASAVWNGGGGGDGYRRIWFERDALLALRHPLLPTLRGVVYTDKIVGFVIDRCTGGDLNSLRRQQTEKMFSDDVIRFYAAELVLALEYLHGLGIVYRDLKPENILIQENGHIMLVDFDLSTKLSPSNSPAHSPLPPPLFAVIKTSSSKKLRSTKSRTRFAGCLTRSTGATASFSPDGSVRPAAAAFVRGGSESPASASSSAKSNSFVGTEEYVAPEMIEGSGHDFAVDWWGLGVVLYEMLYGRTPFRGQTRKETFYRVLVKVPELTGEQTPLRDLIRRLLEKDPARRPTCEEIKCHEFFRGMEWESVLAVARPPFIPSEGTEWIENTAEEEEAERAAAGIDVEKTVEEVLMAKNLQKNITEGNNGDEGQSGPSKYPDFSVF